MMYIWPTGVSWDDYDSGVKMYQYTDGTAQGLYIYRAGAQAVQNNFDGEFYAIGQQVTLLASAPVGAPSAPTVTLYYDPLNSVYVGSDGVVYVKSFGGYANATSDSPSAIQGINFVVGATPPAPPGATKLTANLYMAADGPRWHMIDYGSNSDGYWDGSRFITTGVHEAAGGLVDNFLSVALPATMAVIGFSAAGLGPLAGADAVTSAAPLTETQVVADTVNAVAPSTQSVVITNPASDPFALTGTNPLGESLIPDVNLTATPNAGAFLSNAPAGSVFSFEQQVGLPGSFIQPAVTTFTPYDFHAPQMPGAKEALQTAQTIAKGAAAASALLSSGTGAKPAVSAFHATGAGTPVASDAPIVDSGTLLLAALAVAIVARRKSS